jgi:hypothetical protein
MSTGKGFIDEQKRKDEKAGQRGGGATTMRAKTRILPHRFNLLPQNRNDVIIEWTLFNQCRREISAFYSRFSMTTSEVALIADFKLEYAAFLSVYCRYDWKLSKGSIERIGNNPELLRV